MNESATHPEAPRGSTRASPVQRMGLVAPHYPPRARAARHVGGGGSARAQTRHGGRLPARPRAALLIACLLIGACTRALPEPPQAPLAIPGAWSTVVKADPGDGPSASPAPEQVRPADLARWWSHFGEPELDALVTATLAGNLELAGLRARVRALRVGVPIIAAAALPTVDVAGTGDLRRDDLFTGRFGIPAQTQATFLAGFDARWELDLFGGIDARTRAAGAQAEFADLTASDLALTLTAETVRQWLELRGLRVQQRILLARIDAERERVDLLRDRLRAGLVTEADLALVEAGLASLSAGLPPLAEAITRSGHRLSVLTGRAPGMLRLVDVRPGQELPSPPEVPDPGLPAELLGRRPDVRAALARLEASGALVAAAKADRWPRLMLFGLLASTGEESRTFNVGPGLVYALMPQIRLPLLAGGALGAEVERREAEREEARQYWGRVMLAALEDVEGALTGLRQGQARLTATREALDRARLAEALAAARERGGLEDHFPVLDARRRVWDLEDDESRTRVRLLTLTVALYKALGGGWSASSSPAEAPSNGAE